MVKSLERLIGIKAQSGITMIELLLAMAITTIIGLVLASTTLQMLAINAANSSRMTAVKQVENALYYLNRDVQMASPLQTQLPASGTFPLTLIWTDFQDGNKEHVVTYSLSDGKLGRSETIAGIAQPVSVIATHIDPVNTGYEYNGEAVTINLTAVVDGFRPATETRAFEVQLRPTS